MASFRGFEKQQAMKELSCYNWSIMRNNTLSQPEIPISFMDMVEPWWFESTNANGWNAPPEVYVNGYWRQFPAPAPYVHYLLGVIYILLMITACIGNGIVIFIFAKSKSLRTPGNVFVVGLAITDFLMMAKTPIFIYNSFQMGPFFGDLGCKIYGVIGAYSGLGSALCNTFIAYDRYRVIVHPFSDSPMTKKRAVLCLLAIYLYASPFALLPAFHIWSRYAPEGFLTSCTADYLQRNANGWSYILMTWFFGWMMPIIAILTCYIKIFLAVRTHEKQLKEQAEKMNVQSLRSNINNDRAEIKIAKATFIILLLFMFSWLPYIVVIFTAAFSDPNQRIITPLVSMIPALTIKASACFDPFVYAINHPKYRQALRKEFAWMSIKELSNRKTSRSGAAMKKRSSEDVVTECQSLSA